MIIDTRKGFIKQMLGDNAHLALTWLSIRNFHIHSWCAYGFTGIFAVTWDVRRLTS